MKWTSLCVNHDQVPTLANVKIRPEHAKKRYIHARRDQPIVKADDLAWDSANPYGYYARIHSNKIQSLFVLTRRSARAQQNGRMLKFGRRLR
jgi:hypothetical protein